MGDELTQAISRFIDSEYDEMFLATLEKLKIKLELYERYVDDQDIMGRSIGRRTKFCPVDGMMVSKTQEEIDSEIDLNEDQLFMAELSNIASSIIPMLTTEEDSPSNHPE